MIDSVACADELRRSGEFCLDCISLPRVMPTSTISRYHVIVVGLCGCCAGNHASSLRDDFTIHLSLSSPANPTTPRADQ